MSHRIRLTLAIVWMHLPGCDSGGAAPSPTVSGKIEGSAPDSGRVIVLWSVVATSPDYVYKFGEGTAQARGFAVTIPGEPPPDALNDGQIGVGFLVLVDPAAVTPDGKVMSIEALRSMIRGITTQHALIWKQQAGPPLLKWDGAFPAGLSCGQCAPPPAGERFYQFQPTPCNGLRIENQPTTAVCNWS